MLIKTYLFKRYGKPVKFSSTSETIVNRERIPMQKKKKKYIREYE